MSRVEVREKVPPVEGEGAHRQRAVQTDLENEFELFTSYCAYMSPQTDVESLITCLFEVLGESPAPGP